MSVLDLTISGGIATILLNNPPQNRLDGEVMARFHAALQTVATDASVRAVMVRAQGENFSFGGDINPWLAITPAEMGQNIARGLALANAFEALPIPIIAVVQGNCFGGGFELALRADVILAGESARFRHPEQTLGVITFLGGVQRVAERAGRSRAARWALTSEVVPATDMLAAGVVSEVVPDDQLDAAARMWAARLVRGPTRAHGAHKKLLAAWANGGISAADAIIPELTEQLMHTDDARRGIASAIDALKRGVERPDIDFEGR